jgi:DNA modification methylase
MQQFIIGSSTAGVSALNLKRQCIGLEIESEEFEPAKRNVANINNNITPNNGVNNDN